MKNNPAVLIFPILLLVVGGILGGLWLVFETNKSANLETVSSFRQQIVQSKDRSGGWDFIDSEGKTQKTLDCTPSTEMSGRCLVTEDRKFSFHYTVNRGGNIYTATMLVGKSEVMLKCVHLGDNFISQQVHCGT